MQLKLSDEDQAEYTRRCLANQAVKERAMAAGDKVLARKARQANSALYNEFARKQLHEEQTKTTYEMTLEERITRIEFHLHLN